VGTTIPNATAGLTLVTAPTFSVKAADGEILGGVAVTIAVTAGGGTLVGAPTTTTAGAPTSIGTWTIGKIAGLNSVTVTVGNLEPLVISLFGVAGPPAAIVVAAGDAQAAFAGTALPSALVAQVRDQFGNGVAGSVVNFSVSAGGGSLSPATVTTDQSGNAGGVTWLLGKSAVPQAVVVSSAGFTAIASANVRSEYSVDLRFFGPTPPAEASAAFTEAAARIRAIVTGDVPDVNLPVITANTGLNLSSCGITDLPALNEVVDDVIIYATVTNIDGRGNILASAGPCFVRLASGPSCVPPTGTCPGFSLVGVMRFDVDDIASMVASGRLNAVVLHEMLHVVGVGTNWSARALLTGKGSTDPRFMGSLGIAACNAAGGTSVCSTGIPVENEGGAGSVDSHWRESVFDAELMTSFVENQSVAMPLSNMTIQSLADEGYVVNSAAADPYILPAAAGLRGLRANVGAGEPAAWDIVLQPMFGITQTGSIRKLVVTQ
jgi:hypothetical protein